MFTIDKRSRLPVYEQLINLIVKYVSLGILEADSQLPSVRAMAQELGVNPNTVQKAYRILEDRNIIYTVSGKGAFISQKEENLEAVKNLARQSFSEAVKKSMDMGLTEQELINTVSTIFKGRKQHD